VVLVEGERELTSRLLAKDARLRLIVSASIDEKEMRPAIFSR
jgi:hypothetical protein